MSAPITETPVVATTPVTVVDPVASTVTAPVAAASSTTTAAPTTTATKSTKSTKAPKSRKSRRINVLSKTKHESTHPDGTAKASRRTRPGGFAAREAKHYQDSTNLLIQRNPFRKAVRSLCAEIRYSGPGMDLFQEGVEMFIIDKMRLANQLKQHAGRVTVFPEDYNLASRIMAGKA